MEERVSFGRRRAWQDGLTNATADAGDTDVGDPGGGPMRRVQFGPFVGHLAGGDAAVAADHDNEAGLDAAPHRPPPAGRDYVTLRTARP
jgi:hypothetical protein